MWRSDYSDFSANQHAVHFNLTAVTQIDSLRFTTVYFQMIYLRAGLQRNQSNRTATRSTWFDTAEFTGFKIGQDSAGDAELTIALSPPAGERVLNFTCDNNGL